MQISATFDGIIRGEYSENAQQMCGFSGFAGLFKTSETDSDSRSFADYLGAWFSQSSTGAQNLLAQVKDTFGKIFTRREIYNFTEREVCGDLNRAIYLVSSGTEGQFLSDRLEPWIGLARPISHNLETRVYYWPEIEI